MAGEDKAYAAGRFAGMDKAQRREWQRCQAAYHLERYPGDASPHDTDDVF